jgi:hypothetical protein
MKPRLLRSLALLAFLALPACGAGTEDKPAAKPGEASHDAGKAAVYLDPAKAGADFRVQGEFLGDVEAKDGKKAKLACQVIALGDGKFQAVFLPGGLPGEGWDGKTRLEVDGASQADSSGEALFPQGKAGYHAIQKGDHLDGQNEKGETFALKKVTRQSPAEGAKPTAGAVVLFDGSGVDAWVNGKIDERHLLESGTKTKKAYQNFTLHAEFLLPFKPLGRDQDRGNSGIYIQDRYEVQILDTFGHPPEFNGCGSLYRQHAPSVNLCYPPLQWQTYDIDFHAAQFDPSGKKTHNAVVTVKHNGVVVQDHYELTDKTGAGQKEGAAPGPIQLQGHGNPVFYRNIWIVEK